MSAIRSLIRRTLPGPYVWLRRAWFGHVVSAQYVFSRLHRNRTWGDDETASGHGSTLSSTESLRAELPGLLRELDVRSVLDVGCGDFNWFGAMELDLDRYVGVDVVPELVEANRREHGTDRRRFELLDVIRDRLPSVDLVFCHDCLIHLSDAHATSALRNIRASGARYLAATTAPWVETNRDICTGEFRPINLERPPFDLGPPQRVLFDGSGEERRAAAEGRLPHPRHLAVWPASALPE